MFAVLIALWQAASDTGLLPPLFLPSPLAVVKALADAVAATARWSVHVTASLERIVPGWIIGTAAGLAVGLAMGIFSAARAAGIPIVSALFPIPKIALLPLLILWFGIGEPSKIATIALGVFFPTDDLGLQRLRFGAAQPDPHGARASACRRSTSSPRSSCPARCPASWPASASPPRWRCCWSWRPR